MSAAVLREACRQVGLSAAGAEIIKLGENDLYRLPGRTVVRVSRTGQWRAAVREVQIARWLSSCGVPAVQVLDGVSQPVQVAARPVTFWQELPPHLPGTPTQVATALRRLHTLSPPADIDLGTLAPFVRLHERITEAVTLSEDDRDWLRARLSELVARYAELPDGLVPCVVHGDAWTGNVVSTGDGDIVLLDLERCSIGPPEWDLVSTAIKHTSFAWISQTQYAAFCDQYGHDVTAWLGFELLRDVRELRMACFLAQTASDDQRQRQEAALRVECLRGQRGNRPWPWTPAS